MTLYEFMAKYAGEPNVGDTPENTGQCVGLIEVFTDSLGLVHTWGNAADLMNNADRGSFDVIENTPIATPVPGDIFCFDGYYGGGVGHTGIVVTANVNTVTLFQQNDPEGSTPHLKTYTYDHALGWLHPKINQGDDMSKIGLNEARILAFGLGGRDGHDGRPDALAGETDTDLQSHIGAESNQDIHAWYDSDEFKNHGQAIAGVYASVDKAYQLVDDLKAQGQTQQEAIDSLNKQLKAAQTAAQAPGTTPAPQTTDSPSLNSYSLGELLRAAVGKLLRLK